MLNIHSKLSDQGVTIFSVMSAMAQRLNALNMSQGFPDFPAPPALLEALGQATQDGFNQYAAGDGLLILREQLAKLFLQRDQLQIDPISEITITPEQPLVFLVRFMPWSILAMKSLFLTQAMTVMPRV